MSGLATLRLVPDPSTRTLAGGRVLIGGSPLRVMRLSPPAAALVDGWLSGEYVDDSPAHRRLAERLVDAGIAHPCYATSGLSGSDVTVVVPVRDQSAGLAALLRELSEVARVIVVDDGSVLPVAGAAVRHESPRGPAAARNAGWRLATTRIVAFLDADVMPEPGWLEVLLRQFADARVVAVAPRVRSVPGRGVLARYESDCSPLDLGAVSAPVRPGSRVSYVPSAALLVRRDALANAGGFDERMHVGEDVDLVWRLGAAGGLVRYAPQAVVWHAPRTRWSGWAAQRFWYGSSAAQLAARHGNAVAPVRVSGWSALAWVLVAAGRPVSAIAVAGATSALLPRKLAGVGVPAGEAWRLAARGHLGAGRLLAAAATRSWWPAALPALAASKSGRRVLALALARHAWDWYRWRPPLDPARWIAARVLDDLCYGAGVWWGVARHRRLTAVAPDLSDWPGRRGVRAIQQPAGVDHG